MYVTNVHTDPNGDTVATGRLFSGKIKKADKLHLVDTLGETEVKAVYVDMGSLREEVPEAFGRKFSLLDFEW